MDRILQSENSHPDEQGPEADPPEENVEDVVLGQVFQLLLQLSKLSMMVELRRPSFHTVHLSCILVVVLLS